MLYNELVTSLIFDGMVEIIKDEVEHSSKFAIFKMKNAKKITFS